MSAEDHHFMQFFYAACAAYLPKQPVRDPKKPLPELRGKVKAFVD